jgi:hypothetical protein
MTRFTVINLYSFGMKHSFCIFCNASSNNKPAARATRDYEYADRLIMSIQVILCEQQQARSTRNDIDIMYDFVGQIMLFYAAMQRYALRTYLQT